MSDTRSRLDKSSLGALDPSHCLLLLCDIQEKYHNRILHFEQVVENARKLVETAHLLDIPVIATEQLPDEVLSIKWNCVFWTVLSQITMFHLPN